MLPDMTGTGPFTVTLLDILIIALFGAVMGCCAVIAWVEREHVRDMSGTHRGAASGAE